MFLRRLFNLGKPSENPPPALVPTPTITQGPDGFPISSDSPRREAHEYISAFYAKVPDRIAYYQYREEPDEVTREVLAKPEHELAELVLALVERIVWLSRSDARYSREQSSCCPVLWALLNWILRQPLPYTSQQADFLLAQLCDTETGFASHYPVEPVLHVCEKANKGDGLLPTSHEKLKRIASWLVSRSDDARFRKWRRRIEKLIGPETAFQLIPGEAWSDGALAELASMPDDLRAKWTALLSHCKSATTAAPTPSWSKAAATALESTGWDEFKSRVLRWFPLVDKPRTQHEARLNDHFILDPHAEILRGLAWCASFREDHEIAQALGRLGISAYRKVPGYGPRAAKVGNAAIAALGLMPGRQGIHHLSLVKLRLKPRPAQTAIEKALNAAAARLGLPAQEIEEMIVPTYGLTEVGLCTEGMGDFTAQLTVTGSSTELVWLRTDGKVQKSIPASVKTSHAEDLKELQAAAKDIQRMLPAQRERIDGLFLQQRTWPFAVWRERYLDHPLVGTLARRILWEFTVGVQTVTGVWFNGKLVDIDLKPIEPSAADTIVRLWHPIGKSPEEIAAWRGWLEKQQIQQPFKQAHREIYLLTDAERRTRTYSNRYAAHVLKQHQFNALCALRGWKNQLRLMVDADYTPPYLRLPQWKLRAEFWVEGIGADYGSDTNESGVFLRISTDQVRFYEIDDAQRVAHASGGGYRPDEGGVDTEPLPLERIPPLVFSEVMRDVDLFVGVASVGNDPAWSDGGPEGRYRDYWYSYSFGDLTASSATRRDVLQRLVPRLRIASQCSFEEKFLVVKGSLRTYKVHLGSGNILMSPNDQYLCIAPEQTDELESPVLLPFEGDRTLSVIISKAFLLADDAKIKDSSIVSQIQGR